MKPSAILTLVAQLMAHTGVILSDFGIGTQTIMHGLLLYTTTMFFLIDDLIKSIIKKNERP